jgi:hypothetical protein
MPDYDNNPQSYILPVFPKGIYVHAQTQATPKLADDGGHFSPTISHNSHNQFTFLPECKFTKKWIKTEVHQSTSLDGAIFSSTQTRSQ